MLMNIVCAALGFVVKGVLGAIYGKQGLALIEAKAASFESRIAALEKKAGI